MWSVTLNSPMVDMANPCIEQVDVRLVTRAVMKFRRVTYHRNALSFLNTVDYLP